MTGEIKMVYTVIDSNSISIDIKANRYITRQGIGGKLQ